MKSKHSFDWSVPVRVEMLFTRRKTRRLVVPFPSMRDLETWLRKPRKRWFIRPLMCYGPELTSRRGCSVCVMEVRAA